MLQQNTLNYIRQLSENNNKSWFEANREQYNSAKADFEVLVHLVIDAFGKTDPDIATLQVKDCIFRQYRDIRFSKDKTPYKAHFGASFDRGGKKAGNAGYYLHIEPGNKSMVGGGIWMPEAASLKKLRQEIDYNYDEFLEIINSEPFQQQFGELESGEYKLSREPKGYQKDNPAIEYLKLKSLVATKPLADKEVTSKNLLDTISTSFAALKPLIYFINRSLE